MKEKKVKNILTIYVPDDKLKIVETLDNIRWREKRSMSDIILLAMKEYDERHKEGNEQMKLDSEDLHAIPQLFAYPSTIKNHMNKLNAKEEDNYKFKIQEWIGAFKARFGYEPGY